MVDYAKQTWADNAALPDGVFNAARGNHMEDGIFSAQRRADEAWTRADEAYALALAGGGGGGGGNPFITVASATATASVKSLCDYVCDGTDDQVEINLALKQASRPNDGFGGDGRGEVALVGPRFYVANDNSTAITMYPTTRLRGSGWNTIITPMWASSTVNRGAIELLNENVAHVQVQDLNVGRHNAVTSNGHGIYFLNQNSSDTYEVKTGSDAFIVIKNVLTSLMSRCGIYAGPLTTGSGARETQVFESLAWSCGEQGFYLNSSDCQVSDCRATGGGDFPRFQLSGGNCKIANSKAYFSGNRLGSNTQSDGFVFDSSRLEIANCAAQDNGRWGMRFIGTDVTAVGCVADSNQRANQAGGGFEVASHGVYSGMNAYDRGQTPTSMQTRPVVFTGSPQVSYYGRTGIPTGGVHITGTPGTGSDVRIVRHGTTLYTAV